MARGVKLGSKRGRYASKNKSFEENFDITFNRIQERIRKKMPEYKPNIEEMEYSDIWVSYETLMQTYPEFSEMNKVDQAKFMADELLANWSDKQTEALEEYAAEHNLKLRVPKGMLKYVNLKDMEIYESISDEMYKDITESNPEDDSIYRKDKNGNYMYDEEGRKKLNSYLVKDWFSDNIFGSK